MDDIYNNKKFLEQMRGKRCYSIAGPSESKNLYEQQSNHYLTAINRTFDECRIVNQYDNTARGASLFWNPENKSFEVKRYYLPKIEEIIYQKDYKKIINVNEQLFKTPPYYINKLNQQTDHIPLNGKHRKVKQSTTNDTSSASNWFRNQYGNNFLDSKFKSRYKKFKAVTFNPEVQVIYMIRKKSDNEVCFRGIEILNKENDQQLRNYIMRSAYSKKKLLY